MRSGPLLFIGFLVAHVRTPVFGLRSHSAELSCQISARFVASTPDNYACTLFREGHCHDAADAREGAGDQNNGGYSIQIPGMPLRFSGFADDIELEAPFLGERILTTISVRATDELPAWSARASCKGPRANNY
jgi:hypothetical protein